MNLDDLWSGEFADLHEIDSFGSTFGDDVVFSAAPTPVGRRVRGCSPISEDFFVQGSARDTGHGATLRNAR